ncbi:MAG TPA: outer membrane lipoprotein-sorting protein [Terriglobales bacterium]|nr:outer membrane lipoprotein-sorting protein [Terriglobales bacterium]
MHRELLTLGSLILAIAVVSGYGQKVASPSAGNLPMDGRAPASKDIKDQSVKADVPGIVTHLEQAQLASREHLRAYSVTRDYRFFAQGNDKPDSEVMARINFVPPDTKTYSIEEVQGNSRGAKIVRQILDHEAKLAHGSQNYGLTSATYDFQYVGREWVDGRACHVLAVEPKHKSEDLVEGRVWVDERTYLPLKVEGDLSKSPSWWIKKLHVSLAFGSVDGMWLQTTSRAVAQIRLFGEHIFISRALNFQTGDVVAQSQGPSSVATDARLSSAVRPRASHTRRTLSNPTIIGAGVLAK